MSEAAEIDDRPTRLEPTPHWTELLARLIEDGSRIFRAEGALFEIALRESIQEQMTRLLTGLLLGATALCSLVCMLIATVLLIHKWLEWWMAFGITGALGLALGLMIARFDYYLRLPRDGLTVVSPKDS